MREETIYDLPSHDHPDDVSQVVGAGFGAPGAAAFRLWGYSRTRRIASSQPSYSALR